MDDRLRSIERDHGVFLRSELLDLGYDDKMIRIAIRAGEWVRVRNGAYCFRDTWAAAEAVARHWIRARAVMRVMEGRVALSHISSLVAQGVPVWGADLSMVHVTRLDRGASRRECNVHHHKGRLKDDDLIQRGGLLMTVPPRAVLEAGTLSSVESGLVSTDGALHLGLVTPDELARGYEVMSQWPGAQTLQLVLRLADARSASPGESRSRYLFWSQGLPAPDLQFDVRDENGVLIGTCDFAWPAHRLLGEFDGKIKYGRLLLPGQTPGDAVFAEKRREDRLREATQWSLIRFVWDDLGRPVATGRRLAQSLGRAA
jgi:hypothetical protein